MSKETIYREDAIKAFRSVVAQYVPFLNGINMTLPLECETALRSVPSADRPKEVVAQVTFDEEKLREIVKEAVERFKEEYEIADRWIPCSEKMPEESGSYLTWSAIGFIPDHADKPNTYEGVAIASFSKDSRDWFGTEKVYAWMPLPKPWKGESDAKEA